MSENSRGTEELDTCDHTVRALRGRLGYGFVTVASLAGPSPLVHFAGERG